MNRHLQASIFFFLVFVYTSTSSIGAEFSDYLSEWKKIDPASYSANAKIIAEVQKRSNEKVESQLTALANQEFNNAFGSNINLTDMYKGMGVVEAALAGDLDYAMNSGGDLFISTFMPLMGSYISVVKLTNSALKGVIKDWVEGLYDTKAYYNAITLINNEKANTLSPYIPSYLIKANFNDPRNAYLKNLRDKMISIENKMFYTWLDKDIDYSEAVRILSGYDWSARFRSALGKDPTDQEIFNHFLYRITSTERKEYLETLSIYYIEPQLEREARKIAKTYSQAMQNMLRIIESSLNNQAVSEKQARQQEIQKARKAVQRGQRLTAKALSLMERVTNTLSTQHDKLKHKYLYEMQNSTSYKKSQSIFKEVDGYDKEIVRLNQQFKSDKSVLDSESLRAKYGEGSELNRRAFEFQQKAKDGRTKLEKANREYNKEVAELKIEIEKISTIRDSITAALRSNRILDAINIAISSGWADKAGVHGELNSILKQS